MARIFALASPLSLLQKARDHIPFWFSLLLSLWLLADATQTPLLGSAGALPLLPACLMLGLAFTLLALRPNETPACLLAVYLSMLAALARDNTALPADQIAPLAFQPIHYVWAFALGGVPLYFGWVYTEQDREEQRSRSQHFATITLLLCYALVQTACIFVALRGGKSILPMASENLPLYHQMLFYTPMTLVQHATAFWLLLSHSRRYGEGRNRALVLVFGVALLFITSVILNDSLPHNDSLLQVATSVLTSIIAYLVPLILVYALEKHALFDIRIFIRRAFQYALARNVLTFLTLAPLVALAFVWGIKLKEPSPGHDIPLELLHENMNMLVPSALICGALILLFSGMLTLRVPLLRWFDRVYFREIYDAQRVLSDVGRSLLSFTEPRDIARAALEGMDAVLHPRNAMALCEENGRVFCLAERNYTGYRPPLWPDPALLQVESICEIPALEKRRRAKQVSWTDTLSAPARALLAEARIRLMIPLREEDRTTGVLLLGEKASGMAYTPEDLEMLRALASQIALAMQSARLNREFLRRSARELKAGSVGFVELVERERRLLAADLHDQTLPELRCLLADLQSLADAQRSIQGTEGVGCRVSGVGEQDTEGEKGRRREGEIQSPNYPTTQLPNTQHPTPNAQRPTPERMNPDEMTDHLRQTIANIRDIMESLRPSALEMLGLLPALENELRKAAARARPPLVPKFQALDSARPENLNSFAEMSIFRIGQEAINNACRHSRAKTVRVQISIEAGDWILRVEDDGVGLPKRRQDPNTDDTLPLSERMLDEAPHRGHGLDNMQYRASLIGAAITWDTPDGGKGTRVELRLPWGIMER